jgi:transposase-like protein
MAEVTREGAGGPGSKPGLKARAVERMARAVAGERLDALQRRLEDLEAEVQECRQLNIRLAEVVDLVEELLLPIAAQDEGKIAAAVEKYNRTI